MPPFSPDSSVVERVEPSPNFDERTGLARPDMIILHYTGMQFAHEAVHRLCDPKARVSSHYVVMDNVRYLGTERDYDGWFQQHQLDWLKKDLELVPADGFAPPAFR